MDRNLMISITNELGKISSVNEIKVCEKKYSHIKHPFINHIFGVTYQIKKDNRSAFDNYLKAAEIGITNHNEYLNTIYSNDVGSPLSFLLTEFSLDKLDLKINYNLFANCYVFLSSAIEISGIDAYESLNNRASLMDINEDRASGPFISNYLSPGIIGMVLYLSDYYFSSQGYNKYGMTNSAERCLNRAIYLHNWLEDITIAGKDADSYTLEEISLIGKRLHERLFPNSKKGFLNNNFTVDFNLIKTLYPII